MAKLIGNYTLPGQPTTSQPDSQEAGKPETSVTEFERRAMARLGGSIAFVMKGKNVVWSGTTTRADGASKE
jgi:hypothetical protein